MKECILTSHGFDRAASHSSSEYVCECHGGYWGDYFKEELLNVKIVQGSFNKEDYEYAQESLSELIRDVL